MTTEKEQEKVKFDSRILSSSYLNFFFGAGVNGESIKQMNDLVDTKKLIERKLGRPVIHFESDLLEITKNDCDEVKKSFKKELSEMMGTGGEDDDVA